MKEAGDAAASDYGVKATWQSAEGSLEKQVALIENFINQKVSVILVDPLDKNALLPVINKAAEARIPVVTMGNKVNGNGNTTRFIPTTRTCRWGPRAGHHAGRGRRGGAPGRYPRQFRLRHARKGLRRDDGQGIPAHQGRRRAAHGWDSAKATDATQTWMTTYPT